MSYVKDSIWDMIYCLVEEEYRDKISFAEGEAALKYEVEDIADSIEALAFKVEAYLDMIGRDTDE